MNQKLSSRKGFSMVEILVATGVLGFALAASVTFFINSLVLSEGARNRTIAISHARFVLEDIRNSGYNKASARLASKYWDWDTKAIATKGLFSLPSETIITTKTGAGGILTVTVTVTWAATGGRILSQGLTTIIGES
ncbi:MAG: prepilin-type N-terminal cleavage/methylation domain-containing protein [Candidatus Omnitrophica bacterium]|nr:prepilin-type N-terminal cleavage/methylation domain-containing protein [Candidatus Omnitrophota bacterium]